MGTKGSIRRWNKADDEMRVLIFGDVHGNLPALEIALSRERGNFDRLVCHGDVVNYGPWSNECVQLLAGLDEITLLKGNHEEYFLSGIYPGQNEVARAFFDFCYPFFYHQESILNYASSLVCVDYTVQHTIQNRYIFPDTPLLSIDKNYIIGHSHHQFKRIVDNFSLINTGSLGQNRKWINVIQYLIYDTDSNTISLKNVVYDHFIIINEMKLRKYPEICVNYYLNKSICNG